MKFKHSVMIRWKDPNIIEKGYKVYRSKEPMDINNMPEAIASLERNSTEFIDKDQTIGDTNYYRVSAWIEGYEVFSKEVEIKVSALPGNQELTHYDIERDVGYYGRVSYEEMPTTTQLSTYFNVTQGQVLNNTSEWLKFYVGENAVCNKDGRAKILYYPILPLRFHINWDHLYSRGLIYGTNDNGVMPVGTPTNQMSIYNIKSNSFIVRVMRGVGTDPTTMTTSLVYDPSQGEGSEWNELMYRVHQDIPSRQNGDNWDNLTDQDFKFLGTGEDGSFSWNQEYYTLNTSRRVSRGGSGLSSAPANTQGTTDTRSWRSWRPVLEYIL